MRIRVAYETAYAYERAPRAMIQVLRLTPRGHDGQRVVQWRVQDDGGGRLRRGEDAFGNITHTLTLFRPGDHLRLSVIGEAATTDMAGVMSGALEPLPPGVFLRETALTAPDAAIRAFAEDSALGVGEEPLNRLHALMGAVNRQVRFDVGWTDSGTTAAETLKLGHGVCQDLTHLFIACARLLGSPARYVSGHFVRNDGETDQGAAHAWAEAHVPGLGWVGFDPANGICPTDAHLRVAVGLDYLGAAPVRGSRIGGGAETLSVKLHVADAARGPSQSQSQSQGGASGSQEQSQSQG